MSRLLVGDEHANNPGQTSRAPGGHGGSSHRQPNTGETTAARARKTGNPFLINLQYELNSERDIEAGERSEVPFTLEPRELTTSRPRRLGPIGDHDVSVTPDTLTTATKHHSKRMAKSGTTCAVRTSGPRGSTASPPRWPGRTSRRNSRGSDLRRRACHTATLSAFSGQGGLGGFLARFIVAFLPCANLGLRRTTSTRRAPPIRISDRSDAETALLIHPPTFSRLPAVRVDIRPGRDARARHWKPPRPVSPRTASALPRWRALGRPWTRPPRGGHGASPTPIYYRK